MFKNYLLIARRSMLRTKAYSLLNIGGLSTGMAVGLLIGLWVFDELDYNHSFENYDRLARVYHHITFGDEIMTVNDLPAPFGETLKNNTPGIEQVAVTTWPREYLVSINDNSFSETGMFVYPQFFDMFSVHLLDGAKSDDVHTIAISKSLAKTLFNGDAVGKSVVFNNNDALLVTGVFEDFPANSEIADVQMLLPIRYYYSMNDWQRKSENNWEDYSFQCFVLLDARSSVEQLNPKIKSLLFENVSNDGKALKPEGFLFPMSKWHLYADFKDGINTGGQVRLVWMFGVIGTFVLLLACINFMNLSTARSERRSKEVGIRKVMGSARYQLIFQFLHESWIMVTISFVLALVLALVALPSFNQLSGKSITIPITSPGFIALSLLLILITSFVSGSYPAFFLSSFTPVKVLKGTFRAGRYTSLPRKILVVFQFTISVTLIICTSIVFLQIQYAKNRPAGFDLEGIFHVAIRTDNLAGTDYNVLRNELLATGVVENMAMSDFPITGSMAADASLTWEGMDPNQRPLVAFNNCSHDFPSTNGFQFVEGRDFSRSFASDSNAVIANEMAAALLAPGGSVIGKKNSAWQ
ncbi:MAG: FtsX-like permease family protein [Bacteroidia bacterium]|nr:FtsX-like permease family protein [Bacteroidia bacterium]